MKNIQKYNHFLNEKQNEVDQILDKIVKSGIDSLSPEEQEYLNNYQEPDIWAQMDQEFSDPKRRWQTVFIKLEQELRDKSYSIEELEREAKLEPKIGPRLNILANRLAEYVDPLLDNIKNNKEDLIKQIDYIFTRLKLFLGRENSTTKLCQYYLKVIQDWED